MATLASDWLRDFQLLLWNHWTEFNKTGSRISTSSTKFVFLGSIRKTRWLPWPLIGWDIFNFFSETTERNSTKLDRKQDLNFLYQVCLFRADKKNKMAALASDWLRLFRLLLWNRSTEFNEIWQEARSPSPLPSLCFWGWWEKQDGNVLCYDKFIYQISNRILKDIREKSGKLKCDRKTDGRTDRQRAN